MSSKKQKKKKQHNLAEQQEAQKLAAAEGAGLGSDAGAAAPKKGGKLQMAKVVGKQNLDEGEPAPVGRRFLAYLVDWYLGALCTMIPIAFTASQVNGDMTNVYLVEFPSPYGLIAGASGVLFACLYYIGIPMLWNGQTPGKRMCRLQIRNADGSPVDFTHLVLRQFVGIIVVSGVLATASSVWHQMLTIVTQINFVHPLMYVGFAVTAVSCLLILFRGDHRCIHDFIGGTEVVLAPRKPEPEDEDEDGEPKKSLAF